MINLDQNVQSFEYITPFDVYDRVEIVASENSSYFYPVNETNGRTLVVNCIWGTQDMAQDIYNKIRNYRYCPYNAYGAVLDPAAQLGDAITVNGVESVLNSVDTTFSSLCSADISAPADEEIDHEYPYESHENRDVKRKVAAASASLVVMADEIEGKISSDEAESIITQKVDEVSVVLDNKIGETQTQVTALAGEVSSKIDSGVANSLIQQQFDNIKLSVSSSGGQVTVRLTGDKGFEVDGTTTINGLLSAARISADNITSGTIDAGSVTVSGTLTAAAVYADNIVGGAGSYGGYIPYGVISDSSNLLENLYARSINTNNLGVTSVTGVQDIRFQVGGTTIGGGSVTSNGVTKTWREILEGSSGSAVWG